ncbi:hypothetical protein GPALN_003365 [Globodera pallida]|nr:hypothetical protein GPALN_003365 [Globodera pallida]
MQFVAVFRFDGHDNVTFEAEVQAEQPCHIANYTDFLSCARIGEFFHPIFFGADYTEFQQQFWLNIDEETDFVHFERLLLMIPLLPIVSSSTKTAIFKYRMAIAYNLPVLKMHVLKTLCRDDFDIYAFESNIHECFKLKRNDLKLLLVHYRELCDSDDFDE